MKNHSRSNVSFAKATAQKILSKKKWPTEKNGPNEAGKRRFNNFLNELNVIFAVT